MQREREREIERERERAPILDDVLMAVAINTTALIIKSKGEYNLIISVN